MARSIRFGDLTRTELDACADREATVLVPVGAIEQHGPHLPTDTDAFLAESTALRCAERLEDVIVAPAVPWGLSANHLPLGGTISVQPETYLNLLLDIAKSLIDSRFPNQVWVNGHNSNKLVLGTLVYEVQRRWGVGIGAVTYFDFAAPHLRDICSTPDFHAGEVETSLVMALGDGRVQAIPPGTGTLSERLTSFDAADATRPGPAYVGSSFVERFPDGVAGDPEPATVETGRRLAEANVEGLAQFVSEYAAYRRGLRAAATP